MHSHCQRSKTAFNVPQQQQQGYEPMMCEQKQTDADT